MRMVFLRRFVNIFYVNVNEASFDKNGFSETVRNHHKITRGKYQREWPF